jgi:hypothetical protein
LCCSSEPSRRRRILCPGAIRRSCKR